MVHVRKSLGCNLLGYNKMTALSERCSLVRVQKWPDSAKPGDVKELVYNAELMQNLLTVAGIKRRHVKHLSDAILEHLSAEAQQPEGQRLVALTRAPRHDGTITIEMNWEDLMQVVARVVQAHSFHSNLKLADSLLQRERGVIIMICGTSGTGKSTLASLLGQRLGIPTIMSTDSIRNQLRGFISEEQDPVLHASSYETDSALLRMRPELADEPQRRLIKKGYKAQCSTVLSQVMTLVNMWQSSCASVIIEGVHLHLKQVYVKKEAKHIARMSVRTKYLTTDPSRNKYVKNMRGIRQIQDYLLRTADKVAVPKVANCNVELAADIIHKTVLAALNRQTDPSESMLDQEGRATALLEEFNVVYSQQCATQTQIKETHARIQSLVQGSSVMNGISASTDTMRHLDSPQDSSAQQCTEGPGLTSEMLSEETYASLQASDQSGGKIGPFLPDGVSGLHGGMHSACGALPSTPASAAGSILEPHVGTEDAVHQYFEGQYDSWGLWEQKSLPSGALSPRSSAGGSLGAIDRFLWGDEEGQHSRPGSSASSPRNSMPGHEAGDAEGVQRPDSSNELAMHATSSRVPSHADETMPSVSGTEQQLGLKDIVRARPTPDKDSSSESEASAAEAHMDEFEEPGPRTAGSAPVLVLDSNLSTENGSLCDSTEVQIDDDEALARLWTILLPNSGRWHDAQEPARSAVLLRALVAHLQHSGPTSSLRWPARHMRPAASAPAPLRSFNLSRLRMRSFASSNHASRMHPAAETFYIPHEQRELSITDGVPSLSQISSTASHHSNETTSPRPIPPPSPPTGTHTFSDPVLNPMSPSSFGPLGPHTPPTLPTPLPHALTGTRLEKNVDAPTSPTVSSPHPQPPHLAFQSIFTQKHKPPMVSSGTPAPPLRTVLKQVSEDVEALLQCHDGAHGGALRQLQSVSSHLSVRMSRTDGMHSIHHASTRSSMALIHLTAVAEDVPPEGKVTVNGEAEGGADTVTCDVQPAAASAIQSTAQYVAAGSPACMCSVSSRERQPLYNRTRRKVAGLAVAQRKGRSGMQRSDSFTGIQHSQPDSKRQSGSLPSSPSRHGSTFQCSEQSTVSAVLPDGRHNHCASCSGDDLALEVPGPLSLPTSIGETPTTEDCPGVSAQTNAHDVDNEQAVHGHGVETVYVEHARRSTLCGDHALHQAGRNASAGIHSKGISRPARHGIASMGEKTQHATAGEAAQPDQVCGGRTRAELSTIYDTLDSLQDRQRSCDAESFYNSGEESRLGGCHESSCSCLGTVAWHKGEAPDWHGATGTRITEEAGTDVEEDNMPLVHALVLRVLHQFAATKAQH